MILITSPSKSLDYDKVVPHQHHFKLSLPFFMPEAELLIEQLKKYSIEELMALMGISESLAILNHKRYVDWEASPSLEKGRAAIFAFNGDVYEGLDPYSLNRAQLVYIKQHICILSGLYGALKPFDRLQAYRLEMGVPLTHATGTHLYTFWGKKITSYLNDLCEQNSTRFIINVASNEYFKAVQQPYLHAKIITPIFKDFKNGQYKVISFYAKRARGLMLRFCAQHQVEHPEGLQAFNSEGYQFDPSSSDATNWVFHRRLEA